MKAVVAQSEAQTGHLRVDDTWCPDPGACFSRKTDGLKEEWTEGQTDKRTDRYAIQHISCTDKQDCRDEIE
jgi:hypothetical protein